MNQGIIMIPWLIALLVTVYHVIFVYIGQVYVSVIGEKVSLLTYYPEMKVTAFNYWQCYYPLPMTLSKQLGQAYLWIFRDFWWDISISSDRCLEACK